MWTLMGKIENVLELDINRNVVAGSPEQLREAIRKAGDLRVYTEFRHNEHIDIFSDNPEMQAIVSSNMNEIIEFIINSDIIFLRSFYKI